MNHKVQLYSYAKHYNKPSPQVYLSRCESSSRETLSHHGVLGQKWGERNGPPYPLGPQQHSASEKKAGWQKSLGREADLTTANGGAKIGRFSRFKETHSSNDIPDRALNILDKIREVSSRTGLDLKKNGMSMEEDCNAVDPNYDPNDPLKRNNCGHCSAAYVLRRMGFDVVAEDMAKEDSATGMRIGDFSKYFNGYRYETLLTGSYSTPEGFRSSMSKEILNFCENEDGAMGVMLVGSGYSLGHFISWENRGGQIHYIDSQNKIPDANYIFKSMSVGRILPAACVGRLDNLEINPDTIHELVKNKKKGDLA